MKMALDLDRAELDALQAQIEALRDPNEDYLILAVGVRGPNIDCYEGNAVATVRMGTDEATSEALHLADAISLARGKIIREREAAAKKREEDKKSKAEQPA
jgi:hypothetical protein